MRLESLARVIRSKNAGPCLLTFDVMLPDQAAFASGGMVSIGRTRPAAIACLTTSRGRSEATTPRRNARPSSRAISRTISSV